MKTSSSQLGASLRYLLPTVTVLVLMSNQQVAMGQLVGRNMDLAIRGPSVDDSAAVVTYYTFDPVTVGSEFEFHVGLEQGEDLAPVSIDILDSSVTIDFSRVGSGRFERAEEFNGYVITDKSVGLRPIVGATVNESGTSGIALTEERVRFEFDELSINVEGLNASSRSKIKVDLQFALMGDANLDGEFNSGDFVDVFQSGKFETGELARWSEGDWNADERFDSGDFVVAFQDGGYEMGVRAAVAAVPEPSSWMLLALALLGVGRLRSR